MSLLNTSIRGLHFDQTLGFTNLSRYVMVSVDRYDGRLTDLVFSIKTWIRRPRTLATVTVSMKHQSVLTTTLPLGGTVLLTDCPASVALTIEAAADPNLVTLIATKGCSEVVEANDAEYHHERSDTHPPQMIGGEAPTQMQASC